MTQRRRSTAASLRSSDQPTGVRLTMRPGGVWPPRRESYRTDVSHRVIRGKAMSPADYRRRAEELVGIADRVGDYRSRAALLAMAQSWQHLAAQAEKNLQTVVVYETPEPRQQPQANPQKKND